MKTTWTLAGLPLAIWSMQALAQTPIDCTIFADAASGKRLLREGRCDRRVTPASTFKIAISLMGYDNGFLRDAHTPLLPFREGYVGWNPAWRAATDPSTWISRSVVWYSQQVVGQLGTSAFQHYVQRFKYGNEDVSGKTAQAMALDMPWINSSLAISPDEQIDFLGRLANRQLGLRPDAYVMTSALLRIDSAADGWQVFGKTGSGSPVLADGKSDRAHAYGWFVGWASKGGRTILFARLVQDQQEIAGGAGLRVRDSFLPSLPARLAAF